MASVYHGNHPDALWEKQRWDIHAHTQNVIVHIMAPDVTITKALLVYR